MIRGSKAVHDEVRAWECSSIDDSPMTAKRDTMSNLHPSPLLRPNGNQLFGILSMNTLSTAVTCENKVHCLR